ncbi:MAG: 3-hydroxyacyl-CoA dehydrogenase family protein [Bacteroidota bacterium]
MRSDSKSIFLIGDFTLVREWSEILHNHNFLAGCIVNQTENGKLPSYCKKQATIPKNCYAAFELTILDSGIKENNLLRLDRTLNPKAAIYSTSVTVSTTEQAAWIKNPGRLLGISGFPTFAQRPLIELALSIHTSKSVINMAEELFLQLGKEISVVQDRVGMVMPRILTSLINEAFFAVMDGIATAEDLDAAMKLGANYPRGPIEWANSIGVQYTVALLDAIHRDTGDPRYRIAPSLRQLALGKKWWNG